MRIVARALASSLECAKDHGINDRTYQRGVRELLEKEFLYRSPSDGVYFVNIKFHV